MKLCKVPSGRTVSRKKRKPKNKAPEERTVNLSFNFAKVRNFGKVFWLLIGLKKREFPTKSLALMGTASFFVIAIADKFNVELHFVRNDKKDIALRQAQDKLPAGSRLLKMNQTLFCFLSYSNEIVTIAI